VAETRDLTAIIETVRLQAAETERRAKRRIAITGALCVFVAGYMTWMHTQLSKLDAEAVTVIARAEVQARIPELADRVSEMAVDAAPGLLDQGEAAIMRMPSILRDTVEERLAERTDALIGDMAERLNEGLAKALDPHIEALRNSGTDGKPASLDELMGNLREQYRANAGTLVAELYVAYAREISGVNDYLIHLRENPQLTEREGIHKQIIHASVALRGHFIEPIPAAVGMHESDSAE